MDRCWGTSNLGQNSEKHRPPPFLCSLPRAWTVCDASLDLSAGEHLLLDTNNPSPFPFMASFVLACVKLVLKNLGHWHLYQI